MPVSAIMPDPMEVKMAIAAEGLMEATDAGNKALSIRGKASPAMSAVQEYTTGMVHLCALQRYRLIS